MDKFYNKTMETIRPKLLAQIQTRKLRSQLSYVWRRSKFYKEKLTSAGDKPSSIRKLEDLAKLPFTEKDELRESQEYVLPLGLHVASPIEKVIRIHSSSGTTGRPTYVGITLRDKQVWTEVVARCLFAEGVRPGTKVVHAMGLSFFVGGLPIHDSTEAIGATFIPIGTGASDRLITVVKDVKPETIHCTPSYSIYLAGYLRQKYQMDPQELGFKNIVSGAEPGAGVPSIRKRIETDWNADLREGMGNADVAPIVFGECFAKQGMHYSAQEFIIPELIDPSSGEQVEIADGASGELVYSHIDRECVPLLRFRSHDWVTVWTDKCECGRTGFRMRCIGRTDEMLKIRGVTVYPSAIKDIITSMRPKTTGELQILLERPPPLVEPPLKIKVEYDKSYLGKLNDLKREIEEALRGKLIFSADIELVESGALPQFEMKASYVKKLYE